MLAPGRARHGIACRSAFRTGLAPHGVFLSAADARPLKTCAESFLQTLALICSWSLRQTRRYLQKRSSLRRRCSLDSAEGDGSHPITHAVPEHSALNCLFYSFSWPRSSEKCERVSVVEDASGARLLLIDESCFAQSVLLPGATGSLRDDYIDAFSAVAILADAQGLSTKYRLAVMGVGGGDVVTQLAEIVPHRRIVGWERSAAVLKAAQEFFGLNTDAEHLELRVSDVFAEPEGDSEQFAAVLVDLFVSGGSHGRGSLPSELEHPASWRKLLSKVVSQGWLIANLGSHIDGSVVPRTAAAMSALAEAAHDVGLQVWHLPLELDNSSSSLVLVGTAYDGSLWKDALEARGFSESGRSATARKLALDWVPCSASASNTKLRLTWRCSFVDLKAAASLVQEAVYATKTPAHIVEVGLFPSNLSCNTSDSHHTRGGLRIQWEGSRADLVALELWAREHKAPNHTFTWC